MKKIAICVLVSFVFSLIFYGVSLAQAGEAKISIKDLFSMANRKSYRLGLRGAFISSSDDVNLNKDSVIDLGLEFDAKLNENLDVGPRFGFVSKKLLTSATNATYNAIKFGFGGRMYLMYWGDYGSTHGFVNAYVCAEGDYYIASKSAEIVVTSPASFAGLGAYGGAGIELAFGPNTGGYAEVGYQRTSIKSSDNQKLPIDGIVIATGARLAF
ncbi:MAG: hypothetical protein FD145_1224 [Candidatus Saganbacteria bacterium]|uniref:Outer membrane protein beta-barrel domain-containing protein n=1 Tax=Candidatus Saganbacteria bacterium TaxID=2575572 RepID=A0A833NY81_UNCSA|nr:MAG: hypothetical protein FD145_1224 [Candidatus Saganbacteria bacterium]